MNYDLTNLVITDIVYVFRSQIACEKKTEMQKRNMCGLSFKLFGRSEYYQNGRTLVSDSENVIFLPQGASYSARAVEDGSCVVINFQINSKLQSSNILQIPIIPKNQIKIVSLIDKLYEVYNKNISSYRAKSVLYEIFDVVFCKNNIKDKDLLGPVIDYINTNLSKNDITNKELADLINYSEVYFRKAFKNQYGISPIQYLINRRIYTAKNLLAMQSLSVTEIAELTGFNSIYHFSRIFKQYTGISPVEYKKRNAII